MTIISSLLRSVVHIMSQTVIQGAYVSLYCLCILFIIAG